MRDKETIPGKPPAEHPSRERSDHANLDRPEAHPGTSSARRMPRRRADAPRNGREARH